MLVHLKTRWDTSVVPQIRNFDAMLSLQRAIAALRQRRLRQAAIADLEAMSDHLLGDIGISRADIPEVVEGMIAADARAAAPEPPATSSEAPRPALRREA
jgi:uncharacterized protein YjiS (DUF1127 family)